MSIIAQPTIIAGVCISNCILLKASRPDEKWMSNSNGKFRRCFNPNSPQMTSLGEGFNVPGVDGSTSAVHSITSQAADLMSGSLYLLMYLSGQPANDGKKLRQVRITEMFKSKKK